MGYKKYIMGSLFSLLAAMGWFAYKNNIFIINFPSWPYSQMHKVISPILQKKEVSLYFFHHKLLHDKKIVSWGLDDTENILTVLNFWIFSLQQENGSKKRSTFYFVGLSKSKDELYLGIDNDFLPSNESLYAQWSVIESFLLTLRTSFDFIKTVYFLEKKNYGFDIHFDFSQGVPIEGYGLLMKNC